MAAGDKNGSSTPMDVSDNEEVESVERPGAPTSEEVEALKNALRSVGTSLAASKAAPTTSAPGGSGTPSLSSSSSATPPTRFSYVSPELLAQLQQFFNSQGGAQAPQQLPPR